MQTTSPRLAGIVLGFSFVLAGELTGCGAPGEPVPPSPPVPVTVTDLTVVQAGDGGELSFTLPRKSAGGDQLQEPPAVEILRGSALPDGKPDDKSFRTVGNVPGSLTKSFVSAGHMQYFDPFSPAETQAHPGATVYYRIRTRVSQKRASGDSNTVGLRIFPVAERISKLEARVTETAVELSWPETTRTSGGEVIAGEIGYVVYRGELDPDSAEAATTDISKAVWKAPFLQIGKSGSNAYRDIAFDFGRTYLYIVRSVTLAEGAPLESADSVPAIVTPRDTFPPASPQNVVTAILPGAASGSVSVELSWSIGVETDLGGYRVYRSEEKGSRGQLLTPELLLTPAYRDSSVAIGHHYWYTVTAVDRFGNESAPSVSSVSAVM